jgi:hypothetical protein
VCACFAVWQNAFDHVKWAKLMQILEETGTEKTKYIITSRGKNTGTVKIQLGGKMIDRVDKF